MKNNLRLTSLIILVSISLSPIPSNAQDFAGCIRALVSKLQSEEAFLSQNDPEFGDMGKLLCGYTCTVNVMTIIRKHLGILSPHSSPQAEMKNVLKIAESIYQKKNTYFSPGTSGISEEMLTLLMERLLADANIPSKVTLESLEHENFLVKEISADKLLGGESGNEISILFIKKLTIESDSLMDMTVSTSGHAILSAGYHRDSKTVFLVDPWNPMGNPAQNPLGNASDSASPKPYSPISAKLRKIQIPHLTGPTQLLELNEPLPIGFDRVVENEIIGKSFAIVVGLIRIEILNETAK